MNEAGIIEPVYGENLAKPLPAVLLVSACHAYVCQVTPQQVWLNYQEQYHNYGTKNSRGKVFLDGPCRTFA